MTAASGTTGRHIARVIITVGICALLIGAAAGTSYMIFASEPEAQQESATRKSAALVQTVPAERGTYRPQLSVLGVVEPAREIVLSPRVGGQVIEMQDSLVPGGLVKAGQPLLRIDAADFQHMLTMRQSELREVQAELAVEEGRQEVARQEFKLLGENIDPENRALVLREPQIESIRARLSAAQAAVDQAQLNLDRTVIKAPFDAQILNRTVNLGSFVSPGHPLAHLVGVDEYWIMASVPLRDLRWLQFPHDGQEGSPVSVRQTAAWTQDEYREGRLARLIGAVDQETRLARVLLVVDDPLGRTTDGPPLILGTIVQLQIACEPFKDVIRLKRDYLRQNDTVWIMQDGALQIRHVEVIFSDAQFAYIRDGIEANEQVVTTSLATVTQGLALRTEDETTTTTTDEQATSP